MLKKRQQEYVLPSEHDVVLDNTPQTLYVLVKISNAFTFFLFTKLKHHFLVVWTVNCCLICSTVHVKNWQSSNNYSTMTVFDEICGTRVQYVFRVCYLNDSIDFLPLTDYKKNKAS